MNFQADELFNTIFYQGLYHEVGRMQDDETFALRQLEPGPNGEEPGRIITFERQELMDLYYEQFPEEA